MKSHSYEFETRDVLKRVVAALVPLLAAAAFMHAGVRLNFLPAPCPTLDAERTVLVHRVEAARAAGTAEVLLVGDSSCLMNVSARELERELGRPVLNLATFSFLDLAAHAALVREYVRANPGRLKTVVLLQHPETLRRLAPERYYTNVFAHILAGTDAPPGAGFDGQLRHVLGLEYFQSRVLGRLLPLPLPGAYGRRYGFTHDLDAHLMRERGSLVDPELAPLGKRPEYRLAASLETGSRAFRSALPEGVELLVGMTPVPVRLASQDFQRWQRDHLVVWSAWLHPAVALTNLPAVLPDESFMRATHLREGEISLYTKALADAIRGGRSVL